MVNSGADLSDADLRNADFSLANVTKVHSFTVIVGFRISGNIAGLNFAGNYLFG